MRIKFLETLHVHSFSTTQGFAIVCQHSGKNNLTDVTTALIYSPTSRTLHPIHTGRYPPRTQNSGLETVQINVGWWYQCSNARSGIKKSSQGRRIQAKFVRKTKRPHSVKDTQKRPERVTQTVADTCWLRVRKASGRVSESGRSRPEVEESEIPSVYPSLCCFRRLCSARAAVRLSSVNIAPGSLESLGIAQCASDGGSCFAPVKHCEEIDFQLSNLSALHCAKINLRAQLGH